MSEDREIDPTTNQPGPRTAQSALWGPAKPACDGIVREIVKLRHSNSLRVSRQKLAMIRRKEYALALRYADAGLQRFDAFQSRAPKAAPEAAAQMTRLKYHLFVVRAWALQDLGQPRVAAAQLQTAAELLPTAAAAVCLLAQVRNQLKDTRSERQSRTLCLILSRSDQDIEPEWINWVKDAELEKER
jgi:hypothetical protein